MLVVSRRLFGCMVVATAFCCQAGEFCFDLRTSARRRLLSSSPVVSPDGVVRSSTLRSGSTDATALAVGDKLTFRLFDDVEVVLALKERAESPLGGECFLASSSSNAMMTATVLQTIDGITIEATDFARGRVYSVVSTAERISVRELNPQAGERDTCRMVVPNLTNLTSQTRISLASPSDQPSKLVDVLVAYDCAAKTWAVQNGGGITNFATMAVQKMNAAIANTGFSSVFRFRLVGVMEVDANGGDDFNGVLVSAQQGSGAWAPIKAMRDQVGADTVTVLIDTGTAYGTTGLGYSLVTEDLSSFSEFPYNVCAIRSVAQSHTMTHETGHNLGAGHNDHQLEQPGPQLYDYSAGYYFVADSTRYHTIMAYGTDDGDGNTSQEVPYFSSPNYTCQGVLVGDAHHDNVRTIANTYQSAANWRKQVVPMSYDVYFSPESGSTFTDSILVTLTPGKAGLPVRYTLDGSEPTITSALYTSPISITRTTTIRAVTIVDGVAGPVFEATYSASDLGAGVDATQLAWRTGDDYPWTFQTDSTFDGVDALQSGVIPDSKSGVTWLETEVTGPTMMSFVFRREYMYKSTFCVKLDNSVVFSFNESGSPSEWQMAEVDIPLGKHTVRFEFEKVGCYVGLFNGVYLDQVRFDALSRPPMMLPASAYNEEQAMSFHGMMQVTLTPPNDREGTLFYTMDGSDPTGEGARIYSGPITLTESTRIRAVFVEPGKDPSLEARGMFLERHPVKPGEWTTDVDGVKAAAAKDGRLICVLCVNYSGCYWSRQLYPIATSAAFLDWARANGIYLVTTDESRHFDVKAADAWFWRLRSSYGRSGSASYTTMYFASPSDSETAINEGLGMPGCVVGSITYQGTVETLISGFASVLGESVPAAPVCNVQNLVTAFPVKVQLTNPNGAGKIYYTLDGSFPDKVHGVQYSGAMTISDENVCLRAVVWPDSGSSSAVAEFKFNTIALLLGTKGVEWTTGSEYGWIEDESSSGKMRTPFVSGVARTSWLQGIVVGKGKLVFTLRGCSYSYLNRIAYYVNGVKIHSFGYNGSSDEDIYTHTEEITSDGQTIFRWEYDVLDADHDYSFNGAWLSQVEWIPEKTEVLPELDNPTIAEIAEVLQAAEDPKLAENVTTAAEYAEFREWAGKVKGAGGETAGSDAVMASPNAWLSFALGADTLIETAPADSNLTVEAFSPSTNGTGKFEFTVSVKDIDVSSEASKENLKKVFGLEGTPSLGATAFSADDVDIIFGTPEGGKVKFTAGPKDVGASSFFMKLKVLP